MYVKSPSKLLRLSPAIVKVGACVHNALVRMMFTSKLPLEGNFKYIILQNLPPLLFWLSIGPESYQLSTLVTKSVSDSMTQSCLALIVDF